MTQLPALPAAVDIREVGPRDGLQAEAPVAPHDRAALAVALMRAGARRIEAASFVSPKAVPSMAGAAEVVAQLREALDEEVRPVVTALVPNVRGAADALEAGVDELTVTVAASAVYNEKNVRRTIEESLSEIAQVVDLARESTPVDVVISCAFGSPYEEEILPADVADLARRVVEAGAAALTLADTTGVATPLRIGEVLDAVVAAVGEAPASPGGRLGLHLHETRGTAMANAFAGLELGISRFDTSIGGLGGSPFAPGAGGNLATEDFAAFLAAMGIETGLDQTRLLEAARLAERLVGHDLASRVRTPLAS
ncbi:MAG TPA: hydroxymethylglutaryl-CoA lyase [Acidimicrobiales bacterium]|nr:hydroxymethylglutaryl-CoA lyase [Acidimicrobiales bacterium]